MGFPAVPPLSSDPERTCKKCNDTRVEMHHLRTEKDRAVAYAETAKNQIASLETELIACREATLVGREQETIKKLQRADLTQRRDLDLAYDQISEMRQEVERLQAICIKAKVDTKRPGIPDASPNKPAMGWGAFTGNTGVGN